MDIMSKMSFFDSIHHVFSMQSNAIVVCRAFAAPPWRKMILAALNEKPHGHLNSEESSELLKRLKVNLYVQDLPGRNQITAAVLREILDVADKFKLKILFDEYWEISISTLIEKKGAFYTNFGVWKHIST
uniref:Uncharacterized protein n=1 Tax=Strigamia maritima TaxID=126957 RepID=T1J059_STRMM